MNLIKDLIDKTIFIWFAMVFLAFLVVCSDCSTWIANAATPVEQSKIFSMASTAGSTTVTANASTIKGIIINAVPVNGSYLEKPVLTLTDSTSGQAIIFRMANTGDYTDSIWFDKSVTTAVGNLQLSAYSQNNGTDCTMGPNFAGFTMALTNGAQVTPTPGSAHGLSATVFYGPQIPNCGSSWRHVTSTGVNTVATTSNAVVGLLLNSSTASGTTNIPAVTVTDLATSNTYGYYLQPTFGMGGSNNTVINPGIYSSGYVSFQSHNSNATSPASGPTHPLGFTIATSNSTDDATIFYMPY